MNKNNDCELCRVYREEDNLNISNDGSSKDNHDNLGDQGDQCDQGDQGDPGDQKNQNDPNDPNYKETVVYYYSESELDSDSDKNPNFEKKNGILEKLLKRSNKKRRCFRTKTHFCCEIRISYHLIFKINPGCSWIYGPIYSKSNDISLM